MQNTVKMPLADDQHFTVRVTGNSRGAGAVVQQRQFADHCAGPDRGEFLAVAAHRGLALHDDECFATGLALFGEHATGFERDFVGHFDDAGEIFLGARRKQRNVMQCGERIERV